MTTLEEKKISKYRIENDENIKKMKEMEEEEEEGGGVVAGLALTQSLSCITWG